MLAAWKLFISICLLPTILGTQYILNPTDTWQTILAGQLLPGDVVLFSAGVYTLSDSAAIVNLSGAAGQPITIASLTGVASFVQTTGINAPVWVLSGSYFVIKGIDFSGGNSSITAGTISQAVFDSVTMHDNGRTCFDLSASSCEDVMLVNTHVYNCGQNLSGNCIELGSPSGRTYCSKCSVTQSFVHNCTNHGIYSGPSCNRILIEDNVVSNVRLAGIRTHDDNDLGGGIPTVVQRNFVIVPEASEFGILSIANVDIINNIVLLQYSVNIGIRQDDLVYLPGSVPRNIRIVHNTIAGNCTVASISLTPVNNTLPNSALINNAALCTNGTRVAPSLKFASSNSTVQVTWLKNVYLYGPEPYGFGGVSGGIQSSSPDAEFQSVSQWNLYPTSTGLLVGGGYPVGVTEDFNGVARSTTSPTVGAYEYTTLSNPGWILHEGFKGPLLSPPITSTATPIATTSTASSLPTPIPTGRCDLLEFSGSDCTVAVVTDPVTISTNLTIPILEISVSGDPSIPLISSSGCIEVGSISITLDSAPQNRSIALISSKCQPILTGNVTVTISNSNRTTSSCQDVIQEQYSQQEGIFSVLLVPNNDPTCKGKKKSKAVWYFYLIGGVLLLLGVIIFAIVLWKFKKRPKKQRRKTFSVTVA